MQIHNEIQLTITLETEQVIKVTTIDHKEQDEMSQTSTIQNFRVLEQD